MKKDTSLIPKGPYCYTTIGWTEDNYKEVVCPYWSIDKTKEYQDNGYCSFLDRGDWNFEYGGLLWDKVKECGINEKGVGE